MERDQRKRSFDQAIGKTTLLTGPASGGPASGSVGKRTNTGELFGSGAVLTPSTPTSSSQNVTTAALTERQGELSLGAMGLEPTTRRGSASGAGDLQITQANAGQITEERRDGDEEDMPPSPVHEPEPDLEAQRRAGKKTAPLPMELRPIRGLLPELDKAPSDGGARFRAYFYSALINMASAGSWQAFEKAPFAQPMCQAIANGVRNGFGAFSDFKQSKYVRSFGQVLASASQIEVAAVQLASQLRPGAATHGAHSAGLGLYGAGQGFIGAADLMDPSKRPRGAAYALATGTNFASMGAYAYTAAQGENAASHKAGLVANTSNAVTSLGGAVSHGQAAYDNYKELKAANSPDAGRKRIWMKVLGQSLSSVGYVMNSYAQVAVHLKADDDDKAIQQCANIGTIGMSLIVLGQSITGIGDLYKVKPKKEQATEAEPALALPTLTAATDPDVAIEDEGDTAIPPPPAALVAVVEDELHQNQQREILAHSLSAPPSQRNSPSPPSRELTPEAEAATSSGK